MKYQNKTILITGASSGIGAEFARQFSDLGASMILVARREDKLQALSSELSRAEYLVADLTNSKDLARVVEKIKANQIDILINNAGRGSFGYFEDLNLEAEINQVQLNVVATQALAHAVIPQMKERASGCIVSVSSIAAFQPLPLMATYAATKCFNYQHSMALREELKEFGVRVVTLCPGPTATEFGGVARVPGTATGGPRADVDMVVRETVKGIERNQAVVIPGLRAKGMAWFSKLMPTTFSSWIVGRTLKDVLRKSN